MPVEIEVPTEHLHEAVHEAHHNAGGHGHGSGGGSFTLLVALSSALLAVLAAASALFAGHHANEAMLERVLASDQWSYYQAKGIKASVLQSKLELLASLEKPVKAEEQEKVKAYGRDQAEIAESAREKEHSSEAHLERHNTLAQSVTFFQVAIALGAISVLTRFKPLWFGSLAVGLAGVWFMVFGLMPVQAPAHHAPGEKPAEHGPAQAGSAEH